MRRSLRNVVCFFSAVAVLFGMFLAFLAASGIEQNADVSALVFGICGTVLMLAGVVVSNSIGRMEEDGEEGF